MRGYVSWCVAIALALPLPLVLVLLVVLAPEVGLGYREFITFESSGIVISGCDWNLVVRRYKGGIERNDIHGAREHSDIDEEGVVLIVHDYSDRGRDEIVMIMNLYFESDSLGVSYVDLKTVQQLRIGGWTLLVIALVLCIPVTIKSWAALRARRWGRRGCCSACGYSLYQCMSDVCPECGQVRSGWAVSV